MKKLEEAEREEVHLARIAQKQEKKKHKEMKSLAKIVSGYVGKKENKPLYNSTSYGGYGNYTAKDTKKYKLTDFDTYRYSAFWHNQSSLESLHSKVGQAIMELAAKINSGEAGQREAEQFGARLLNCSFLVDGTPNINWSELGTKIHENRIANKMELEDKITEGYSYRKSATTTTSYGNWKGHYGPYDDDEEDMIARPALTSNSSMTSAYNSDKAKIGDAEEEDGYPIEFVWEQDEIHNIQFYIDKFEETPDDGWTTGRYIEGNRKDVFGWLGCYEEVKESGGKVEVFTSAADSLVRMFNGNGEFGSGWELITAICDGRHVSYEQDTPKERIIAALNDLKEGAGHQLEMMS